MADVLGQVKSALGITGNYQDATLKVYINEVKAYMVSAGVDESLVESDASAGVIARGVTDLWTFGSGKLSEYFYQRVTQLVYALDTGKYITFKSGDFGTSYPINIVGVDIAETDKVIFTCGEVTKEYINVTDNCVLVTFSREESASLVTGTYNWTLKICKDTSVVTVVTDGVLIVS